MTPPQSIVLRPHEWHTQSSQWKTPRLSPRHAAVHVINFERMLNQEDTWSKSSRCSKIRPKTPRVASRKKSAQNCDGRLATATRVTRRKRFFHIKTHSSDIRPCLLRGLRTDWRETVSLMDASWTALCNEGRFTGPLVKTHAPPSLLVSPKLLSHQSSMQSKSVLALSPH